MNIRDNKMIAKALTVVSTNMLSKAANSMCMIIFHQPKQPEALKKFRKF